MPPAARQRSRRHVAWLLVAIGWWLPIETASANENASGALVIAGGAALPDSVRVRFVELAGGPSRARIVVLPTASIYADDPAERDGFLDPWRERGVASVELLHTRDRALAEQAAFAEPLATATAVWISGGDQRKLIAAYGGTPVEAALHGVLTRGGAIGGTSAGAAVMSNPMIQGGRETAEIGVGFGFLPGVLVDQHFVARNRIVRLRDALRTRPKLAGLGVDESTAAVIVRGVVTVVGESTVTAIFPGDSATTGREVVLNDGDAMPLAELRGPVAAAVE